MITPEPTITVNGVELSEGQAMTVRVALLVFLSTLTSNPRDFAVAIGEELAGNYVARGREVEDMMVRPRK